MSLKNHKFKINKKKFNYRSKKIIIKATLVISTSILLILTSISITSGKLQAQDQIPLENISNNHGKQTEEIIKETSKKTTENNSYIDPEMIELLDLKPEEIADYQQLLIADGLYREGNKKAAEKIYRQVKPSFQTKGYREVGLKQIPIYNPSQLEPDGAVYWRLYQEAKDNKKLKSKILAPLELLVENHPQFIPGQIKYAEVLKFYGENEKAFKVLTAAAEKYPNEPELLRVKIEADREQEQWLQASLSARRFVLFNPNHPQAPEFKQIADENLEEYKDELRGKLTENAILNVITGGVGFALTGNILGPLSAAETTFLLLQGESAIGDRFARRLTQVLPLVEDEEVLQYVREMGQEMAEVAGRDEFNYEFYVIKDENINAFALPGGKIFINAGAISKTNSKAEIAGLMAHEVSHAVLSHGFQLVTQGGVTANLGRLVPFVGGIGSNLLVLDYSREMEEEADIFGTRLLAANNYAADGLRNLMVILDEENREAPPAWLSTHPEPESRVEYMESLITNNNLNRYSYEGVEKHWQMRAKVKEILNEKKEEEKPQLRIRR